MDNKNVTAVSQQKPSKLRKSTNLQKFNANLQKLNEDISLSVEVLSYSRLSPLPLLTTSFLLSAELPLFIGSDRSSPSAIVGPLCLSQELLPQGQQLSQQLTQQPQHPPQHGSSWADKMAAEE